jgi:hypothetical protein
MNDMSVLNFIRSSGLNYRQFKDFLNETKVTLHTTHVCWVSGGKVLHYYYLKKSKLSSSKQGWGEGQPIISHSKDAN